MLPPGIKFILISIPRLLFAPLILTLGYYAASLALRFDPDLPKWAQILALVLSPVVVFPVQILWNEFKKRQEARALGAIPPPVTRGKLPGNFDVLLSLTGDKQGYLGMPLLYYGLSDFHKSLQIASKNLEHSRNYGWTYNFRVFWEDRVCFFDHINFFLSSLRFP